MTVMVIIRSSSCHLNNLTIRTLAQPINFLYFDTWTNTGLCQQSLNHFQFNSVPYFSFRAYFDLRISKDLTWLYSTKQKSSSKQIVTKSIDWCRPAFFYQDNHVWRFWNTGLESEHRFSAGAGRIPSSLVVKLSDIMTVSTIHSVKKLGMFWQRLWSITPPNTLTGTTW